MLLIERINEWSVIGEEGGLLLTISESNTNGVFSSLIIISLLSVTSSTSSTAYFHLALIALPASVNGPLLHRMTSCRGLINGLPQVHSLYLGQSLAR